MCGLIGATVLDVDVDESRSIQLRVDEGRIFTIPLDAERGTGNEAAHFVPGMNRPIAIWYVTLRGATKGDYLLAFTLPGHGAPAGYDVSRFSGGLPA